MTCPAGALCTEWRRIEDLAARARAGQVDREQAARDLEVLGHEAVAMGEVALARAEELRGGAP